MGAVRTINKICEANRDLTDPNKLVNVKDLLELSMQWFEFNHKMAEDLTDQLQNLKNAKKTNKNATMNCAQEELLNSDRFKNAKNNLGICQDALQRIKMDLMKSASLRDRRQLEMIVLHL